MSCCGCLEVPARVTNLFRHQELMMKFTELTGLNIKENRFMCDECVGMLEKFHDFKERCIEIYDSLETPQYNSPKAEKSETNVIDESNSSYFVNDELIEYDDDSLEADPLVKQEDDDEEEEDTEILFEEPEKKPKYRTRYTPETKQEIVSAAIACGNREASFQFGVDESLIRRWRRSLEPIINEPPSTSTTEEKPATETSETSDTSRVVKKRRAYTAGWKLEVVNYAEVTGNRQAAKVFGIDESCIRKWRVAKKMLIEINRERGTKRKPNLHWNELELALKTWVLDQMNSGVLLKPKEIREKSLEIAREMNIENFRGTPSYIFKFMERYHIPGREVKKGTKTVKDETVIVQ